MSDSGTPLESLETGDMPITADAAHMQAIIRDMNASGADVESSQHQQQPHPQMHPQMQQHQPPMYPMHAPPPPMYQQQRPNYIAVDDDGGNYRPKKKNMWSNLVEQVRDPIVVVVLVFVLSLPVLHTFVGKYATWAFAVGGQLSWLGLLLKAVIAGLLFGVYRTGSSLLGF